MGVDADRLRHGAEERHPVTHHLYGRGRRLRVHPEAVAEGVKGELALGLHFLFPHLLATRWILQICATERRVKETATGTCVCG